MLNIDCATDKLCYLQAEVRLLVGFVASVNIVVLFNLLTFIVLVVSIHTTMKSTKMSTLNSIVMCPTQKKTAHFYWNIFFVGPHVDSSIDGIDKEFGGVVVSFLCHHSAAWTNFADNICAQQQDTTSVCSKVEKTFNFSNTTNSTENKDIKSLAARKITVIPVTQV